MSNNEIRGKKCLIFNDGKLRELGFFSLWTVCCKETMDSMPEMMFTNDQMTIYRRKRAENFWSQLGKINKELGLDPPNYKEEVINVAGTGI